MCVCVCLQKTINCKNKLAQRNEWRNNETSDHVIRLSSRQFINSSSKHFFYKQLYFQSQRAVASEILGNEAESWLEVGYQK